ncbi:hypothetical protein BZG72_04280 [Salinivibrio sp. PR6]|uniref:hypothetical protein n=1 Tax=Salinivibrio sp. PR6 TaxID=1909485 RepID=UPI000988970C|nr:hypothetical protein [Salinivibrio sp. PR6]OOE84017.1 hypothetical protein BZG72_04280 [Salinivibrio sp. PR6]
MIDKEERERRAKIIAESSSGIHPPLEAYYIHSLLYSAARSLEAFERYDHYKNSDVPASYLISTVQEAVGHAAALSRFFWPSPQGKKSEPYTRKLKEARGNRLRKAFKLDESSPLYNRELRNAWEHFDERLDMYLLEHEAGMFFPSCIVDSHALADDPVGHVFKLLDPEEECLVIMGCKYFFSPIRDEVSRIANDCLRYDKQGARLPCE